MFLSAWPGPNYGRNQAYNEKFSWLAFAYRAVFFVYAFNIENEGHPQEKIHRFTLSNLSSPMLANGDFLPTYTIFGFDPDAVFKPECGKNPSQTT